MDLFKELRAPNSNDSVHRFELNIRWNSGVEAMTRRRELSRQVRHNSLDSWHLADGKARRHSLYIDTHTHGVYNTKCARVTIKNKREQVDERNDENLDKKCVHYLQSYTTRKGWSEREGGGLE